MTVVDVSRPKHILYLAPDLFGPPGGIARYCRLVALALTQANIRLTVIALHDRPDQKATAKAALPAVDYHPCASRRAIFSQKAVSALKARPDIILVGHPHFAALGWFLARASGARLINFMYGIDIWDPLSTVRRWAFQRSDSWISISAYTAEKASKANTLPLNKIHILHNCLDPQLETQVASAESEEPFSILTVARISQAQDNHKGHDYVIKALPGLLQDFPKLIYHIVGGGEGRVGLEQLASEVGVTEAVRFHGIVPDADLAAHYSKASIFVMPSRGEGFGFVFLEAMAHGKPIIAGNQDAAVEVIKQGETGLLVNPTSIEELSQAISALLADDNRRHKMGVCGAETVQHSFGFDSFQRNLLQHLGEVKNKA